MENYLTMDDKVVVFAGVSGKDILSKIKDGNENDEEEDNDDEHTDPSHSLLAAHFNL